MISDFPRAAARVSEGFCPLCDRKLRLDGLDDLWECGPCGVSWALTVVDGRPHIWPSRRLTPPEIRALYARREKAEFPCGKCGARVLIDAPEPGETITVLCARCLP